MNVEVGVHGKRRARAYNGFVIGTLSGSKAEGTRPFRSQNLSGTEVSGMNVPFTPWNFCLWELLFCGTSSLYVFIFICENVYKCTHYLPYTSRGNKIKLVTNNMRFLLYNV